MLIQILVFLFLLIVTPIFIIIVLKFNKSIEKILVTPNMPIVENDYRKEFTEGYTLGILKKIKQNKNGTKLIEFYPIDVEQGENIKYPYVQAVVVKDEYFKPFSNGELSTRRNRIKLITRNLSQIPEKLIDETEGKWLLKEGYLGHVCHLDGNLVKKAAETLQAQSKAISTVGLSPAIVEQAKEEYKKIREIVQPEHNEDKK